LKRAVIQATECLKQSNETPIEIEGINGENWSTWISRSTFENLCKELFEKIIIFTKNLIQNVNMTTNQIERIIFVGEASKMPKIRELLFDLFRNATVEESVAPEEVVVAGAAHRAALLDKNDILEDIVVVEMNSITLGIETQGGLMIGLIPRNVRLPFSKSVVVTTTKNGQISIPIRIIEGERPRAMDNHRITTFYLKGVIPAPAGTAKINVTFTLNEHNILVISVQHLSSDLTYVKTLLLDDLRLSEDEVKKAVKQAEEMREQDEELRLAIESRNRFENYLHRMKGQLSNMGMSDQNRKKAMLLVNEAIDWVESHEKEIVGIYKMQFRKIWDELNVLIQDSSSTSKQEGL
jgi:heat shock protein 5